jgi:AraC family transcriptional regulator
METQLVGALTDATAGTEQSHHWMHHVITLLDAAIRQLGDKNPAAQCTLLEATQFLQKQTAVQSARSVAVARGCLLAWQARRVREYIDAHITDRLFVAELATLVRQSEAHFIRAFKRTFGEPPHAFVIRRRLEFAVDYMVQTEAPLATIALQCGFADQAHLCRVFRQATGLSPALWRRARKAHDEQHNLVTPAIDNLKERRRVA